MKRGTQTRFAPFAVLAVICVAAVVFGVLLEQVVLAQSAFKMARVRRETTAAEEANQALLLQMTKLSSPARIESYARDRLGMIEPSSVEYLVADVGSSDRRVALSRPRIGASGASGAAAPSGAEQDAEP
jgi:cell division protein FtsL